MMMIYYYLLSICNGYTKTAKLSTDSSSWNGATAQILTDTIIDQIAKELIILEC